MTYDIWAEGYEITGGGSKAILITRGAKGRTFADACMNYARSVKSLEFATHFNKEKLTFWGCRLFDNETDARRSFG